MNLYKNLPTTYSLFLKLTDYVIQSGFILMTCSSESEQFHQMVQK